MKKIANKKGKEGIMVASKCCGSCANWKNNLTGRCDKEYLHTVKNDTCEKNYRPRNPTQLKYEKMWYELKEYAGQTRDDFLKNIIDQIEKKLDKQK